MASLDELANAGITAINEGRVDEAIDHFIGALELAPNRPDMNHALATAYLHRGEIGSALPHLQRAVELAAPYTEEQYQELKRQFHLDLAKAQMLMSHLSDAQETLKYIQQTWPDVLEPSLLLAQLLLGSCRLDEGLQVYRAIADDSQWEKELRQAADSVVGAVSAWRESEEPALVFLEAHRDSYVEYFDEIARAQTMNGWYAEAARMGRGPHGEARPIIAEGARSYAMTRVDLVDPHTGEVSGVYSEQEPMIVTVEGLEPLGQHPVMLPWTGHPFEVWVSSQCPWHWLMITVQFGAPAEGDTLLEALDATIADWYIKGYNGDFGQNESGRFHYITDPDPIGDRAVCYTLDLGRAKLEAIHALMRRLAVLNDYHPIQRVLIGADKLPD